MIEHKLTIPTVEFGKIKSKNVRARKIIRQKDKQTIKLKPHNLQFDGNKSDHLLERILPNEGIRQSFTRLKHIDSKQ
jgi:hypothetical protein